MAVDRSARVLRRLKGQAVVLADVPTVAVPVVPVAGAQRCITYRQILDLLNSASQTMSFAVLVFIASKGQRH